MKLAKKNKVIILTVTTAVVVLSISGYLVYANKNTPKNIEKSISTETNKDVTLESSSNTIIEETNKEVTMPSSENTSTEQQGVEDKSISTNNSQNKEKDTNTNSNVSASVGNVPKTNDSSGNTKPKESEQTTPPPSTPQPSTPPPTTPTPPPPAPEPTPTPKYTVRGDLATQVFNSVNKYRTDNGMSGLTRVSSYNSLAEKYLAYRAGIGDKPDITNVWANYCKVQAWNDIIEMPDIIGDSLQGSGSTSVVVIEYNGVFHICFAIGR